MGYLKLQKNVSYDSSTCRLNYVLNVNLRIIYGNSKIFIILKYATR